jgi:hypothetical protein
MQTTRLESAAGGSAVCHRRMTSGMAGLVVHGSQLPGHGNMADVRGARTVWYAAGGEPQPLPPPRQPQVRSHCIGRPPNPLRRPS